MSSISSPNSEIYTNLSIYIPRIFNNITVERIRNCFHSLSIGVVSRIDLIDRDSDQHDNKTRMAFVHFKSWCDNPSSKNLREKIQNPKEMAKIVYDDPYYWILLPNKNPKSEDQVKNELMFYHQQKTMVAMIERIQSLEHAIENIDKNANDFNEELRDFILSPNAVESSGTSSILEQIINQVGNDLEEDEEAATEEETSEAATEEETSEAETDEEEEEHPEWKDVTNESIVEDGLSMEELSQQSHNFQQEHSLMQDNNGSEQSQTSWWPDFLTPVPKN